MLQCPVRKIRPPKFNRGTLIEIHIADIHFGVIDTISNINRSIFNED